MSRVSRVRLAKLDQPLDVIRLEHHQAEHVVRPCLPRAEAAREETERLRQVRFIGVRQSSEIFRRPHHQQLDRPQSLPLLFGRCVDQLVDLPQLHRVAIELIEKDRVEQHAGDLRRRRIAGDHRPVGLLRVLA